MQFACGNISVSETTQLIAQTYFRQPLKYHLAINKLLNIYIFYILDKLLDLFFIKMLELDVRKLLVFHQTDIIF